MCVPENKREMLEEILKIHFPDSEVPGIADQIEGIYKEEVA